MTRTTQTKELKVYQQQDDDVDVDEEEEEKVAPKTIRTINGSDHSLSFATFPAIGVHPTPEDDYLDGECQHQKCILLPRSTKTPTYDHRNDQNRRWVQGDIRLDYE